LSAALRFALSQSAQVARKSFLGICEGAKEDKAGWSGFLRHLKERGLKGVRLIISDACLGDMRERRRCRDRLYITPVASAVPGVFPFSMQAQQSIIVDPNRR
jgi:hypothetical protein